MSFPIKEKRMHNQQAKYTVYISVEKKILWNVNCSIFKYLSLLRYIPLDPKPWSIFTRDWTKLGIKKMKMFHLLVPLFSPFAIYYNFHQLLLLQKIPCIDYPCFIGKTTLRRLNLLRYKGTEVILFLQIIWTEWERRTNPQNTYLCYLHGFQTILSTVCTFFLQINQQVHDFNEQKQLNEFSHTSTITVQSYNQFNA